MTEPLLAALRAVRDEITKLRVVEVGILNLLGGEPMPQTKSVPPADLPARSEPAPDQRPSPTEPKPKSPRRIAIGYRRPNPYRNRIAAMIEIDGPVTIPEVLDRFPDLAKQTAYNLLCSTGWFEKLPNDNPRDYNRYQLTDKGREEYAKAKAEEKAHEAAIEN